MSRPIGGQDAIVNVAAKVVVQMMDVDPDDSIPDHGLVAAHAYDAAMAWFREGIERGLICSCENCIDEDLGQILGIVRVPKEMQS